MEHLSDRLAQLKTSKLNEKMKEAASKGAAKGTSLLGRLKQSQKIPAQKIPAQKISTRELQASEQITPVRKRVLTKDDLPPLELYELESKQREAQRKERKRRLKQTKRTKIIVKKPGFFGSVFKPLVVAFAWLFAIWGTTGIYTNYTRSYERHVNYNKVHVDQTAFEIFQKSHIPSDQIHLIVKGFDGQVKKVAASKSQLNAFLHEMDRDLTAAKADILNKKDAQMNALFAGVFADKDQSIKAYADWFFAWKRSYIVLKETMTSAVSNVMKTGRYESLKEAVSHDIKDYFMKHYKQQVLKPDLRDEKLRGGLEKIARTAHKSYQIAIARNDQKMRDFIKQKTTYLDDVGPNAKLTNLKLDWDTQQWKAPSHLIEDKAVEGVMGVGRTAASGVVGAMVLGPATGRIMSTVFGGLSSRFVTSVGSRIAFTQNGAVAGTAVEPGGGTIVGGVVGFLLGTAADYFINKANEKFNRGKFVKANTQAMDQTISLWREKLNNQLDGSIKSWFDAAKSGLILPRLKEVPSAQKPIISAGL